MNIPEGFVLVPVLPTKAMVSAMNVCEWVEDVYAAMIDAAPPVEIPAYDEAKERDLFEAFHRKSCGLEGRDLESEFEREGDGYVYQMADDGWKYWKACAQSRDGSVSDE